jgi:hypothetical protein
MAEKINPLEIAKSSRDMDVNGLVQFFYNHGSKFWSWGAQNFANIKNRGLQFKVNGHHHKGHVYLFVNAADLFDIYRLQVNHRFNVVYLLLYTVRFI